VTDEGADKEEPPGKGVGNRLKVGSHHFCNHAFRRFPAMPLAA
jgi:hypothetical protein